MPRLASRRRRLLTSRALIKCSSNKVSRAQTPRHQCHLLLLIASLPTIDNRQCLMKETVMTLRQLLAVSLRLIIRPIVRLNRVSDAAFGEPRACA